MPRSRALLGTLGIIASLARPLGAHAQSPDTAWVTVDGHRMHLLVSGRGGATIVLESGSGSTHRAWGSLQAELAPFARVVSYDRAGFGGSAVCTRPRTARVVAEELHAALREAGIAPPYLLVGWSLGGAFVRVFAAMYPGEVVGLVLVDPVSENFYERAEREHPVLFHQLDSADMADTASQPPGERAELAAWDSSMAQARASDAMLGAPAILLSSPRTDLREIGAIWIDEQRKWVARAPRARQIVVDGTGHALHRQRPEIVIEAIRELMRAAPDR